MSKNTRWALVIVGVVILVAAGYFISREDEGTKATEQQEATPAVTAPTGATGGATGGTPTGGATGGGDSNGGATGDGGGSTPNNGTGGAKPDDNGTGGAKVSTQLGPLLRAGKITKINAEKGDTVHLRARSAQADHLHIHGYDLTVELPAGKTVKYKFKADIDGAFELEFEEQGLQVAELKVSP